MSFILEALKKSEKKRRGKNIPSAPTIHAPATAMDKKKRNRAVSIITLIIIGPPILFWFYNSKPQPTPNTIVATPPHRPVPTKIEHLKKTPIVPSTEVKPTNPKTDPKADPTTDLKETTMEKSILPALRNENKVYQLSQLPISIKNQLPTLKISLHAYARNNPNASMIQFNDHIMREGDNVTNNIKLEKITVAGAILSYDGYLFLVPRRNN